MLIPATRYPDCDAALAFLRDVVGLGEHRVFRDDGGGIVHAEMTLGTGLFMFGPDTTPGDFGRFLIAPAETGGRVTLSIYAVLPDIAAAYARAVAAGADIAQPLDAQGHGGTAFTLRDPGGHVWTLGDYDPLA